MPRLICIALRELRRYPAKPIVDIAGNQLAEAVEGGRYLMIGIVKESIGFAFRVGDVSQIVAAAVSQRNRAAPAVRHGNQTHGAGAAVIEREAMIFQIRCRRDPIAGIVAERHGLAVRINDVGAPS